MPRVAEETPCRALLYDILQAHGDRPTRSEESARLFIAADDLLENPKRDHVADEKACHQVLREIWRWNLRAGGEGGSPRPHVSSRPGRKPADLWERLCTLIDEFEGSN